MINVKPIPAIALLIIFSLLLWIVFGGLPKDKAEAIEISDPVDITIEPNETGYSFNIWEPNEIQKVSLDFIPTWPDYIELEKDLVIDNRGELRWYNDYNVIPKGTKIYFKEDE